MLKALRYPFAQRDGNAFIQHIDQIQKWVKDEFQELQAKQVLTDETHVHRFWIEPKDISVMRQEDDKRTTVMLDPFEMQVKTQRMRLDAQGKLVDDEHGDEGRKIFFANPQRQTPITGPAIIIDKKTSQIYFLPKDEEQHYPLTADNNHLCATLDMSKPDDKRIYLDPLYATSNHAKLTPEGALIIDEQNVKYAFLFSYEVCVRSKLPDHYSAEYIFARRMSLHYNRLRFSERQRGTPKGYQNHHVISHNNKLTKDHPLLRLAGFDLQSQANRIFLPKYDSDDVHPTRSLHRGKHTASGGYHEYIVSKMDDIYERGQVANTKKQI